MQKLTLSILLGAISLALTTSHADSFERPHPREVQILGRKVADWQIETFDEAAKYRAISASRRERNAREFRELENHHELDWTNGVLYTGMDQFRQIAVNPRTYTDWLVMIGDRNGWRPYYRPYFADDHIACLSFLSLYEDFGDPAMIDEVRNVFDHILRYPKTGSLEYRKRVGSYAFDTDVLNRWGWCDALFMGPPVWAKMAKITGESKYLEFMDQEWHATYDLLYDKEEKLFYRDTRFFTRSEKNGEKVFWSRGNGWVISGLALTIPHLPEDWEGRQFYIDVFREMAGVLKAIQHKDGTWHMGLLGDEKDYPVKESSGTALITHALAWGINQGILDGEEYEPTVLKAWYALEECVTPEGLLGYVQPIGNAPGEAYPDKTEVYGIGAFLLATTEVYRLVQE